MTLVVHASKHGSAQRYAEWIAEALGSPAAPSSEVDAQRLADEDVVVFCASIYGPKLRDCSILREAMQRGGPTRWVLVTVGLSDPSLSAKRDELVASKFDDDLRQR